MTINGHKVSLIDDGTMDTVISVDGEMVRFSHEYACEFRDDKTGALTAEGFKALALEAIEDASL